LIRAGYKIQGHIQQHSRPHLFSFLWASAAGSGSGSFWLPARGARFAHRTRTATIHPSVHPSFPWSLLVV